jgi:hypothetical protein
LKAPALRQNRLPRAPKIFDLDQSRLPHATKTISHGGVSTDFIIDPAELLSLSMLTVAHQSESKAWQYAFIRGG